MEITLSEAEAKHLILKHFGLEATLNQRGLLHVLKSEHTVTLTSNTGYSPVQDAPKDVPDDCFVVDGVNFDAQD